MTTDLKGKTVFVTGGSRGIGLAIAVICAQHGANVALIGKTDVPDPRLPGTLFTAAAEVEKAGGRALPLKCDIREESQLADAVSKCVSHFGGIDILVNNASAIFPKPTPQVPMKRFDLMMSVNMRGTFMATKLCLPHLVESAKRGRNPHVLNLAPPPNMDPKWFAEHTAYTMSKMGMALCVLGHSEEFKPHGIAVNALWPRTAIATAAVKNVLAGDEGMRMCRKVEIMADAAYVVLTSDAKKCTGNFFVDDKVLAHVGVTDLEKYSVVPGTKHFLPDYFVEDSDGDGKGLRSKL